MRKLNHAIGAAADHPLVKRGMAGGADDEEVGADVGRELDDVADRVPGQEVGVKLDVRLLGHVLRALQNAAKAWRPGRFLP
jgi:hypothetical protein